VIARGALLLLFATTLAGCPRSVGTVATADAGAATNEPANANDITRYPYEKKLKDVSATLLKDGVVRKSPPNGTPITTLPKGTSVTQIAETSGAFLVTYDDASGKRMMGWIEENAFSTAPAPVAHGGGGGGGGSHDAGPAPPPPPPGTIFTPPVNGQCPSGFVKSTAGCYRACSADSDCPSATKCKAGVAGSAKVCTTG
jgi:hypothetical protein